MTAPMAKATKEPAAAPTASRARPDRARAPHERACRGRSPGRSKMRWAIAPPRRAGSPSPGRRGQLGLLLLGHRLHLGPLERDLALEQLALALHRDVLAGGHAERPREQAGDPGQQDEARVARRGAGHAHDQREVAHEAVADPEDHGPQRPRTATGAMPALAARDLGGAGGPAGDGDAVAALAGHVAELVARLELVPDDRRARVRRRRWRPPRARRPGRRRGPPRRPRGP